MVLSPQHLAFGIAADVLNLYRETAISRSRGVVHRNTMTLRRVGDKDRSLCRFIPHPLILF